MPGRRRPGPGLAWGGEKAAGPQPGLGEKEVTLTVSLRATSAEAGSSTPGTPPVGTPQHEGYLTGASPGSFCHLVRSRLPAPPDRQLLPSSYEKETLLSAEKTRCCLGLQGYTAPAIVKETQGERMKTKV